MSNNFSLHRLFKNFIIVLYLNASYLKNDIRRERVQEATLNSQALQSAIEVALFESLKGFSYRIFIMIGILQAYQPLSHTVNHLNGIRL